MAAFELTVDDSSPLISYAPDGAWSDSPSDDTLLPSYLAGSLHTTSQTGATATITFNGTGISIFGGNRPNYGTYTFSIDGQTVANGNADSSDPLVNQLLGSQSGLANGQHTAVLTNTGSNSFIDIDWIQLQTRMGAQSITLTNTTIDDNSPLITYGPLASDWTSENETIYINNTTHFTTAAGAFASLTFSGGAVAIYGTVSPSHAGLQVSLDGVVSTFTGGSGFVERLHSQTLLYYRSNIGNSLQHNVVLSADPQNNAGYIDIDAFIVFQASRANGTSGPKSSSSSSPHGKPPNNHFNVFPTSVIIAIAVTIGVVLVLVLVLLLVYLRRRRRQRRRQEEEVVVTSTLPRSPRTPDLPIQRPKLMEDGFNFTAEFGPLQSSDRNSMFSSTSATPMLGMVRAVEPRPPPRFVPESAASSMIDGL